MFANWESRTCMASPGKWPTGFSQHKTTTSSPSIFGTTYFCGSTDGQCCGLVNGPLDYMHVSWPHRLSIFYRDWIIHVIIKLDI